MLNNVFVFDIETVPDVDAARRLWDLTNLSDENVAKVMAAKRQQETDGASDFLRHHLQRIVAISAVFLKDDRLSVWSLGEESSSEAELIARFFEGVERYSPTLVSWNGGGFDLPVLNYRALIHGINAARFWEMGDEDRDFKWNNYLSRYHTRHLDLMDHLAMYTGRANAPLDDLAKLCGFPGKMGVDGSQVWSLYQEGRLQEIRDYCETDVVNTYLVYCRYQLLRGRLTRDAYDAEIALVRTSLQTIDAPHWRDYLSLWQ